MIEIPKFQRRYEWTSDKAAAFRFDEDCVVSGKERLKSIREKE